MNKDASLRSPVWLSPEQVCEHVPGMTKDILQDRRKRGLRPAHHKPSARTVTYELTEIDDWVRSTVKPTRESR